jgi:hypothetical protein
LRTQLLAKINAQVVQAQTKVKALLSASPGLIVAVSEAQKEALFALLAEAIGDAESRLARKWYEAGCGARLSVADWGTLVRELTAFVRHGAAADQLAVPYSLSARLLREAALVDNELLCRCARTGGREGGREGRHARTHAGSRVARMRGCEEERAPERHAHARARVRVHVSERPSGSLSACTSLAPPLPLASPRGCARALSLALPRALAACPPCPCPCAAW